MLYNVYCDETCHLINDGINVMVLGAIWCPQTKIKEINDRIKEIKVRNGVSEIMELKWTKISPAKIDLYKDLVNYFFDDNDLHFRAVIIPDKKKLDHNYFQQTHDTWYYKMYFDMLKVIFSPIDKYEVYIDIKDTNSYKKSQKLKEVCCNFIYDFSHMIIRKLQPIRSDEVQIMQLVDIITGALGYENRNFKEGFINSEAKKEIIKLIKLRSNYSLRKSTLLREEKLNILMWKAMELC
ncbi:MAG: DUF3800 domain-containing protein [Succinivibrionaceae bacterium]|nr:DUF3800 domain-containing protein [Succinivibrionaceae bacterium]